MYNAFKDANKVEDKGLKVLLPYMKSKCMNGQFVTTNKGRIAKEIQMRYGDAFMNTTDGRVLAVEFKIEAKDKYGNLFLETWSNCDYRMRKLGWLHHLDADYLWYYFLESDDLYIIDFPRLWAWAFDDGFIYDYRKAPQSKRVQKNKTVGRLVPIADLIGLNLIVSHRNPAKELRETKISSLNRIKKAS